MRTTIEKGERGGDDLSIRLVRVGRRLVARPSAAAKDLPEVDVAALIEEERNREPR